MPKLEQSSGGPVGIREKLNENKAVSFGGAIGLTLLALGCLLYEVHQIRHPWGTALASGYFSDDDGASYFTAPLSQIPPFDHNGKTAVGAIIFSCGGGSGFIGYLQRYTPTGVQLIRSPSPLEPLKASDVEISLPLQGEKGWAKGGTRNAAAITMVKCPDGSMETPVQMRP